MIEFEGIELLDVNEIAEITKLSTVSVRQMCRDQELKATRIKRKWYVSKRELKAYLTGDTQAETEDC